MKPVNVKGEPSANESPVGWENERCVALIAGDSGSGKSFFIANIPDAVIYDTDIGGGLTYADTRIRSNSSERVMVQSYSEILDDIRRRVQERRLRKTVVIDHITSLQQEAGIRHNPTGERDYGRSSAMATREWRRIREAVRNLDCNLFVAAHLKGEFEGGEEIGRVADGARNVEADVGIVIYLQHRKAGGYPATARVVKWRRDPLDPRGSVPATFPFTVAEFRKIIGAGMDRARSDVTLASTEQVTELETLLKVVRLPEGTTQRWLTRAGADSFSELTADQIGRCIAYARSLVVGRDTANANKKGGVA